MTFLFGIAYFARGKLLTFRGVVHPWNQFSLPTTFPCLQMQSQTFLCSGMKWCIPWLILGGHFVGQTFWAITALRKRTWGKHHILVNHFQFFRVFRSFCWHGQSQLLGSRRFFCGTTMEKSGRKKTWGKEIERISVSRIDPTEIQKLQRIDGHEPVWAFVFWNFLKVFSTLWYPLFACCATFCPLDWRQNCEIPIVLPLNFLKISHGTHLSPMC